MTKADDINNAAARAIMALHGIPTKAEGDQKMEDGFYIAVVGDGDEGEPIRVQDGRWYSVGCADPHDLGSVLIIRPLNVAVPTKADREEERRWANLREKNYAEYRHQYRKKYGRDPGHRRWGRSS